MAEPGEAAGAFIGDGPFEVLKSMLGRLSPKWILSMRSICKASRENLCDNTLLIRLHRLAPPRPLLCFDSVACPDLITTGFRLLSHRRGCADLVLTNWVLLWFSQSATAVVRHVLRESLVPHRMFREPKPNVSLPNSAAGILNGMC